MTRFAAPIAESIWDLKYRFKAADGTPHDRTVEDSWRRVARALAAPEAEPQPWEDRFYAALQDFRFLPAGRILAGAGTGREVTLFNCFVMGTIPDSLDGIFDALREAALTMQQGGGIGYDFSTIRPRGAEVKSVAADASGPLSFMDVWDAMCRTIMSAGSRRGAMMATMRCDHPDIEDFIAVKADPARLRMFNLSVLVTDAFMAAIRDDASWDLQFGGKVYHTLPARDLWNRIMQATYDFAEPGVIFIDRINAMNNLHYCETIAATNPCGEQPLPPYGACLLGSVNLARLVRQPFEEGAHVDAAELDDLVAVAVRMMDNVVDVSRFPLEAQQAEARAKRRIGLGVTGLADALIMKGLRYGSDEAAAQTEAWLHRIARAAYRASVELAREKGAFELFEAEAFLAGGTMQAMDADIRDEIARHGIRNALLTSIAPTGTISLYAGNVSSGIEPVFAYRYTRKVLQKDGSRTEEEVEDYAVRLWREMFGDTDLPEQFVNAQTLAPQDHVRMQAAAQRWIDSSISKTINVPADIGFEAFKDVYWQAFETGCKGCTTYRPNEVTGSVLSVGGSERPKGDTLVERLVDAMAHRKMNAKRLAEKAGLNPTGVYDIINRKSLSPKIETLEKIANALNLKIADLIGDTPAAPPGGGFAPTRGRELPTETSAHPEDMAAGLDNGEVIYMAEPLDRPGELEGRTYKLKWPDSNHAIYVTVNDIILAGRRRPFEVFINSKNMEHYAWTVALTRMISAVFRRGGDVSFVVEELKAVFDPRGGAWMGGRYVPSILAAIGGVLERHMVEIGFLAGEGLGLKEDPTAQVVGLDAPRGPSCPACGSYDMRMIEGCMTCAACGHSKCS